MKPKQSNSLDRLRHHVTGAIERGEKEAIVAVTKPKHTPGPAWKIANNTDTVDIAQGCIGLDPFRGSIPRDVWDHIRTNRGLHIQIRHNKDAQTFSQANDLARLIAAAPEMFAFLERMERFFQDNPNGYQDLASFCDQALKKARGE